MKEKRPLNL